MDQQTFNNLKVGDRIKVVECPTAAVVGKCGKVMWTGVVSGTAFVTVLLDDARNPTEACVLYPSEIELEALATTTFRVGDRVRIKKTTLSHYAGNEGVVYSVNDTCKTLRVLFPTNPSLPITYTDDEVELVKEAAAKPQKKVIVDYPHVCRKCKGPAYVGFVDVNCPKCGRY